MCRVGSPASAHGVLLVGDPTQRKLLLEANRRPPSVVDVNRAVTAGQGRRRGDKRAGVRVCAAVAAAGPCPGGRSGV